MPIKTGGGGSSALRIRKLKDLLWNSHDPVTRKEGNRLYDRCLKVVETCSASDIFEAFKDDVKFCEFVVGFSEAFDGLIEKFSWEQIFYVMIKHRKLILGPKFQGAVTDKSAAALWMIQNGDQEIKLPAHEVYTMMLQLNDLMDLNALVDRMNYPKLLEFISAAVEAVPTHIRSLNDVCWWKDGKTYELVMLFHRCHEKYPQMPYDTFYTGEQNILMLLSESLVLLRGNQETREKAKYIYKFFNLASKASLIELENSIQMRHELQDAFFRTLFEGIQSTTLNIAIRRDHIVRDALAQIETKKAYELRRELKVKFEGEDGVDEGGVKKEFFQMLIRACFNPEYGLFRYQEESRLHWFSPTSDDKMNHEAAEDCYSIGKLFGLAIYNSVLLDVSFPHAFYKMLVDKPVDIDDLIELEPSLGKTLSKILTMDEEEFKEAGLDGIPFEIDVPSGPMQSGKALKFRLPSMHETVTFDNRLEFVQLYAEAILHRTIELPLQAFIRGFQFTFGKSILFHFHPKEIEGLLCGSQEFNYSELQSSTTYEGGYTEDTLVIIWFWQIIFEFDQVDRCKFLAFVSGTDRAPVGGLKDLKLKIIKNGDDDDRLPTSHTCFNTLLLNNYSSKEKLKYWLKMAIENNTGFGLQ